MTLQELNQHLELLDRLAKAEEMVTALRDTAYIQSPTLSDMPRTSGIKDKVGNLAAEIADMDARIAYFKSEISNNESQIVNFIENIDNDQTRLIFRLRFLRGLAWKEVAAIIGGRNSEESVRMMCYRYLNG